MIFYEKGHKGKAIAEAEEQQLVRNAGQFQGFFRKADLFRILLQNNCTGIRFYNAGGLKEKERRLIAVGISADGSELNSRKNVGYLKSAPKHSPARKLNKKNATAAVLKTKAARTTPAEKKQFTFASYFSQLMLEQLLAPRGGRLMDGISFYILPLESSAISDVKTHLGVACMLTEDEIMPMENAPGDLIPSHIMSDQTCPKYCVVIEKETKVSFIAEQAGPDNIKYLVVWDLSNA